MEQIGLIVFGHGSSVESANEAVRGVARRVAAAGGFPLVAAAFLELGEPDLQSAAATLTAQGATRLVVLPYFLTLGIHLKRDLPRLMEEARAALSVTIEATAPLDGHPALEQILVERAKEALA